MANDTGEKKADYYFGGIKDLDLEQIETEVLNESVYLDVFAGSDLRIKEDLQPIRDGLAKVLQLEGVTYRWNKEKVPAADDKRRAGLIAQQVAASMPELVRADADSGVLAVDYAKLTAYLVEAVKDLEKRIQVLEKTCNG